MRRMAQPVTRARSYAIAPSIAAFSGGASCQRDHAGAVDVDADRVCLAVAPPACCLENAPFESKMKDERCMKG